MDKRKLKVLHIIKSLGRGGAEMLLPATLKIHQKDQFEFEYLYFLPWKNQMVEAINQQGSKVFCIAANNNMQLMFKVFIVARLVREHEIALIHAHLPWAGILARIVGKMTRVPTVYTEHNKQERYHFLTRWMNLITMNFLTSVVAVSRDVEQSVLTCKPTIKSKLQTILNGVDLQHFAPGFTSERNIHAEMGIPQSAFVIGTIAVFRSQKRLDLWLQIAKEINRRRPHTHFIIVGDGPLKEKLTAEAKALNLENHVHFTGLQTEVRPYLSALNLYMISSIFEGLPIALLEAMASCLPVISTDAGGIKEVIRHEQDGLLCGIDQSDLLVNFAVSFIDNPEMCVRYGMNARNRVAANFSLQKMVKELEELYIRIHQMT